MNTNNQSIDKRLVLSALWISQFLLWTFGDALALLQDFSDPVENSLLTMVAAPLALLQAAMIIGNLVVSQKVMRWVNMILVLVFVFFNAGFIAEAHVGWEYVLGVGYLATNGLILWYAWKNK